MSNWPHYKRYLRQYDACSRKLNDVLYGMCGDMPGHADQGEIWAKVWIIGRSYASGIERHAANGLEPIVRALAGSATWLDEGLTALGKLEPVPRHEHLPAVTALHGRLGNLLAQHTRGGNQVRSFVSKYLHFHAPVVPIYDSVVTSQIRARDWYPWSRARTAQHPTPPGADEEYWRHCVRIACIVDDWLADGLHPTARNIDTYAYAWSMDG